LFAYPLSPEARGNALTGIEKTKLKKFKWFKSPLIKSVFISLQNNYQIKIVLLFLPKLINIQVMKRLLLIIFVFTVGVVYSKTIPKAVVTLEAGSGKEVIASQKTGESGKAGFYFLDSGYYQMLIEFPQQEGKYIEGKQKHSTLTKVAYNGVKRIYYYQGIEGYFSVKIIGLKRIEKESFQAIFRERYKGEKLQILMGQFQASKAGASISVEVEAITAADFKKATDKLGSDISTISIQGVK
jgi:hypothetical protein